MSRLKPETPIRQPTSESFYLISMVLKIWKINAAGGWGWGGWQAGKGLSLAPPQNPALGPVL